MDVVFGGLRLRAEPGSVMTPRPASEGLVEAAIKLVGDKAARVADVGPRKEDGMKAREVVTGLPGHPTHRR
jgi:hypothetical protein